MPRELGGDRRREVWVAKRLTRDIERKAWHAGPAREARDRAAHDPAIECGHHAAALEHRQKRPGRQQPLFFFAHAQQCRGEGFVGKTVLVRADAMQKVDVNIVCL